VRGRLVFAASRDEWEIAHGESYQTIVNGAIVPGPGKAAVKTQFGTAFACADGAVVMARRFEDGWRSNEVTRRSAGRARLGTDNARVLVADDDGVLSLIGRDGTDLVLRDSGKLRGAVLAELDPRGEGLEAATAGYNRRVIVVSRIDGSWSPEVIYEDADKLHHLAAADLDGTPGAELVTCGFGGRVVILRRRR